MITTHCNTSQASGPDQWQSHLIRRICAKFLEARAVLDRQTYIPGVVAGLVDDAAGFFDALAVSIPRPIAVSATVALRGPLTREPGDPVEPEHDLQDDKSDERVEPLPRWIADEGGRHVEKRSIKASMGDFRNDHLASLAEPLGHAKVPNGVTIGPKGYAMNTVGDCLSPVFNEGDIALCDPDQVAAAGDFVAIWRKGGDRQPHRSGPKKSDSRISEVSALIDGASRMKRSKTDETTPPQPRSGLQGQSGAGSA